jgi:hypothetical protein
MQCITFTWHTNASELSSVDAAISHARLLFLYITPRHREYLSLRTQTMKTGYFLGMLLIGLLLTVKPLARSGALSAHSTPSCGLCLRQSDMTVARCADDALNATSVRNSLAGVSGLRKTASRSHVCDSRIVSLRSDSGPASSASPAPPSCLSVPRHSRYFPLRI